MSQEAGINQKTEEQFQREKRLSARAMRKQVGAFGIMIFFTFVAFAVVQAEFSSNFVKPLILLFAAVQVSLQFYFFMHWDEKKGTGMPQFFMYSALLVTFTMVLAFVTIIWW